MKIKWLIIAGVAIVVLGFLWKWAFLGLLIVGIITSVRYLKGKIKGSL